MTNLSDFTGDDLDQILDAPGAVLKGATLADGRPGAFQFLKEMTSGAKVFREAQEHENDFVRSVAIGMRDRLKEQDAAEAEAVANPASQVGVAAAAAATERAATEGARPDPEGETARAVELTGAAVALLRARGDEKDAVAYGEWLLRIAEQVAGAAGSKEGGFFSRRVKVSAGERAFIDRLTTAVGG
ncbi:hypothetical protein C8K30_114142 [Promicromonospora sp. AC04]|uniref:hypothetical protein n=1 Tax=Promicromonospora sp. AC04 TaxID=2135723 RepID=UPI000D394E46|nr:hypothetical protein [Promicromonospora sp. AC04]PUB21599.1 hypothetical protein C8K30_114142 [Promicromonospora sp. AC04]